MLYAYAFTPTLKAPVNDNPSLIKLDALPATVPSSAFLLTCRQAEQDAAVIFHAAQRSFWNNNTAFPVDLNDDWEGEDARKERHSEVLNLLEEASLFPELGDEYVNAIKNLAITVKTEIKTFKIRLIGRVQHNTKHWVLDPSSSTSPTLG